MARYWMRDTLEDGGVDRIVSEPAELSHNSLSYLFIW